MITHPGARTRAFYAWELDDLKCRPGVRQFMLRWGAEILAQRFMQWQHRPFGSAPRIEIRNIKGDPYCLGRSLIVLTRADHLNVTLLHELVHALGYGSRSNPHNRAFVLKYIDALAWWFSWDADELRLQAHQWGLI